jgi:hypothetical protein
VATGRVLAAITSASAQSGIDRSLAQLDPETRLEQIRSLEAMRRSTATRIRIIRTAPSSRDFKAGQ